jgi:alginate O-acetyltransferase complex protein AlgI
MIFYSFSFFVFFLIIVLLFFNCKDRITRIKVIAFSNLIFYSLFSIPFAFYLVLFISVNYLFGKRISMTQIESKRNLYFYCAIVMNLLSLFIFKYYTSLFEFLDHFISFSHHGPMLSFIKPGIIAPLGLSFYTFQNLSYIIDVKRLKIRAENNYLNYLTYGTLFLTISSGPIIRASQFLPQLKKKHSFIWSNFYNGFLLVTIGLFLKVVIADNLSGYIDRVFNPFIPATSVLNKWTGLYAYAIQIFSDFAGYSNMAIGLGLILGFRIPQNFNSPYASFSFADFWKRWHITLSTWIRDYLFLPISYKLSRFLKADKYFHIKTEYLIYAVSSVISMTLCGLWHGAELHFILWGTGFGVFLSLERFFKFYKKPKNKLLLILQKMIIFQLICMLWIMFKLDFSSAIRFYQEMFIFSPNSLDVLTALPIIGIFIVLILTLVIQNFINENFCIKVLFHKKFSSFLYILFISLMWISIFTLNGKPSPFVYFKF